MVMLYGQHTDETAVQLAHHYTQAGDQTVATTYLLMAGNRALKEAALDEAIRYHRAALSGWPAADEAKRAETLHKLGECLWMTGQAKEALETLQACHVIWKKLGNHLGAGAVQRLIGRVCWEQGERAISLQHYHQALRILENAPESIELAQAISSISQMHMLASEYEPAIAWGERALALAKRLGAQAVVVHASNNIGVALTVSTNPERGLTLLRQSLEQALALNLPHEVGRVSINLGESLTWHGHYAQAEAIFAELLVYAAQAGTTLLQRMALVRLIELDWWQGRWALALRRCQEIAGWRNDFRGAIVPKVWASTELGWIYNDLGQREVARLELEEELEAARAMDEAQTTVPHLGQLARSLAMLGRDEEVAMLIDEMLALLERTPSVHACSVTPLMFAFQWSTQTPATPQSLHRAGECLRYLERIAALFRSQEGLAALAVEQFRRAAGAWDKLNRPFDQMRALKWLGQSLYQEGMMGEAQATFRQAYDLVQILAGQLEDVYLKVSFLNSALVRELQSNWSQSTAGPVI